MHSTIVIAFFLLVDTVFAACGYGTLCPTTAPCCSKWGFCGTTDAYCGADCICGCSGLPTDMTCSLIPSASDEYTNCLPLDCPSVTLVEDHFDTYTSNVITLDDYYSFANFPNGGTSLSTNPSTRWETDTGGFYYANGWGHSGTPNTWTDRYFFRLNTRNFDAGNAVVSWKYKSAAFGENGFSVEGSDAVDVWFHYQTQYNLYVLQFDRTDDKLVAKRKVPALGFGGNAGDISNKGVYYVLQSDASSPSGPGKTWDITWPNGMAALAHDKTTVYTFDASIVALTNGKVQLKLWRDGILAASWSDDGHSGVAASGATQGSDVHAGYYNSVAGWQTWWGEALTRPGATGFRADNIQCWFDDFYVRNITSWDSDGGADPPQPTVSSSNTHGDIDPVSSTSSSTVDDGDDDAVSSSASNVDDDAHEQSTSQSSDSDGSASRTSGGGGGGGGGDGKKSDDTANVASSMSKSALAVMSSLIVIALLLA